MTGAQHAPEEPPTTTRPVGVHCASLQPAEHSPRTHTAALAADSAATESRMVMRIRCITVVETEVGLQGLLPANSRRDPFRLQWPQDLFLHDANGRVTR